MYTNLLINADDFGLHVDINKAIDDCISFGTVNSVSVVTNGEAIDFELLRQFKKYRIFIGIHICWVGEKWLTQNIILKDWKHLLYETLTGGTSFYHKLYMEAEAQIYELVSRGLPVDHIDSHQHIHHFPIHWNIIARLQQKYKIQRVRTAKVADSNLQKTGVSGMFLQAVANYRFLASSYYCVGLKHAGHYDYEKIVQELCISTGKNTELIVHPGINNNSLSSKYINWDFDWELEFKALQSPLFLTCVKSNHFKLIKKDSL